VAPRACAQLHFFYEPKKCAIDKTVVQVSCGQSHILALTGAAPARPLMLCANRRPADKGNVYAWGNGEYGQLGHGVRGCLNQPRLVLKDKNISQVLAPALRVFAVRVGGTTRC
jgi:alpha-tubulin suppressor-like RCC1 family protein